MTSLPEQRATKPSLALGVLRQTSFSIPEGYLQALQGAFPDLPLYVQDYTQVADTHVQAKAVELESRGGEIPRSRASALNTLVNTISEDFVLLFQAGWLPVQTCSEGLLVDLCELISSHPTWLLIAGEDGNREDSHLVSTIEEADAPVLRLAKSRATYMVLLRGEKTELIEADLVSPVILLSVGRAIEWGLSWDESLGGREHDDFLLQAKALRQRTGNGLVFFCHQLAGGFGNLGLSPRDYGGEDSASILLSRKWGIARRSRQGRFGQEVIWLGRDYLWVRALLSFTSILDDLGIPWWVSGSTLHSLEDSGNFALDAQSITVSVAVAGDQWVGLERAVDRSSFTLARSVGQPRHGLKWELLFPVPEDEGWSFGPISLRVDFHEGNRPATIRRHIEAWGREVNFPGDQGAPSDGPNGVENSGMVPPEPGLIPEGRKRRLKGRISAVLGALYRVRVHLRLGSFATFLGRHPRLHFAWRLPTRVFLFLGRRVVEVLERIPRRPLSGSFWAVRYWVRRRRTPAEPSTSFSLNDMPIRWINLHERQVRRDRLQAEFQRMGITHHRRFEAIYETPGALGCALSHLAVLTEEQSTAPALMVCEDDIEFLVEGDLLEVIIREFMANDTLDVLCLGYNVFGRRRDVSPNLQIGRLIHTASCYVVKSRAVPHLVRSFSESARHLATGHPEWFYAIDQHWVRLQNGKLFFAIPRQRAVRQRADYSSIEQGGVNYGV